MFSAMILHFLCAWNAVVLTFGTPAPSAHVAVIGVLHDGRIIEHSQPDQGPTGEQSFAVQLPLTVAVLILSCTAPFPVEWVFTDRSPGLSDNMLRLHVNTSRVTSSGALWSAPSLEQKHEYTFQTNLTFTFRPPAEPRQEICREATTGGHRRLVTSVTSEMHGRFIRLLVTRNQPPPETDIEPRYGNDLNCSHVMEFYDSPVAEPGAGTHICCSALQPEADYRLFTRGCSNPSNCRGLFRQTNCTRKMNGLPRRDMNECISTSELASYGASGVVVCGHPSVDSISVAVQYYTSVSLCGGDAHLYIEQDTDPSAVGGKMLELCPLPHSTLYVGERIEFTCVGTFYYFAGGFHLILRRNSGQSTPSEEQRLSGVETQIFTSYAPERDFIRSARMYNASVTLNDTDVVEVLCVAPVWNSYEWVNQSRQITVMHPTPVKFSDTAAEEVTISGDVNITCSAIGDPLPRLSWSNLTEAFMRPLPNRPTDPHIVMEVEFGNWPSSSDFAVVTVYCRADQDRINRTDWKIYRLRRYQGPKFPVMMVLSITGGVLILGIAVACLAWWRRVMQTKDRWRSLNQDEIDEFFHGRSYLATQEVEEDSPPAYVIDVAEKSAWGSKYDFTFEVALGHDLILGPKMAKGEFGQIYTGHLKGRPVAVKKNLAFASMLDFRASLYELKLLIYIGPHPNIVQLLGAVTSNVERRELYLVLEHCSHGDLKTYMCRNREQILGRGRRRGVANSTSIGAASCRTYLSSEHLKLVQVAEMGLMPCALEILDALVFLRSKRVVHGDIAARNVVLDAELNAKICDFGMSHEVQAVEGYIYGVSPQVRQPCNSSAPESLDPDHREYSFHSDVYSFAVLLWEMFSLGKEPWAGVRPERIFSILQKGECLPIPHVQTQDSCVEVCLVPMAIYEKMKECWILEPLLRPTVEELQDFFRTKLSN